MNSELAIEDAIIRDTGAIGFPGASAIRRVRVSRDSGVVDLMLLPSDVDAKVVLIEAKDRRNKEALSKVIGQLLMYYGGALRLGYQGLERIREFATSESDLAVSHDRISLVRLAGTSPTDAAWSLLEKGKKLSPSDVHLCIALNGEPSRGLRDALLAVREFHNLEIDVAVVDSDGVHLADW